MQGSEKVIDVRKWIVPLFCVAFVLAMIGCFGAVIAYPETPQPAPLSKASCAAELPYGAPSPKAQLICRAGYALDYDPAAKIPVWDAHVLTPKHSFGCIARSNAFAADDSLPAAERAKPSDYLHSGYDIGHMSPDADFSYDTALERQSFILTNMAPQLPGLNRQTWKYLEEDIRAWAWAGDPLWIITGPAYDAKSDRKIGADKVDVPTAFWKVIVDEKTNEYLAFEMPQKAGLGTDLAKFMVPLKTIEGQTRIEIPLPRNAIHSELLWPADEKGYNAAEKAACR
jgi:endonuclease G